MDSFVPQALRFIDRYSLVFYIVSAVGILYYLRQARGAMRHRRYSPFPIEREEASALQRDAIVLMLVFAAILGATFYIDRMLVLGDPPPPIEEPAPEGTPAPDESGRAPAPSATATSPALAVRPSATLSPTVLLTATRRPTRTATTGPPPEETPDTALPATETPTSPSPAPSSAVPPPLSTPPTVTAIPTQPPPPTATPPPPPPTVPPPPTAPPPPSVPAASCPTAGVRITSPANGSVVSGAVAIFGTASIPQFQFYKLEVGSGAPPGAVASIGDVSRTPVEGGQLGSWNAGAFRSGIWTLRLTVVDQTGNFPPPCDIHLIIP